MASSWDELTISFSRMSMFPFFDIAHYLVSVMALKRQPVTVWHLEYRLQLESLPVYIYDYDNHSPPNSSVFSIDQTGAEAVAWKNPISSWFTAMLHCFGGGILSCLLLAEPPLRFLANNTNILLASSIWYIVFFCPCDLVSQGYSFLPVQLLAAGMKEVTRTWKIVGGVTHANSHYKNGWIVMIAIGWARGAGGSIITNFELLVKGGWKPQADEWMKMSYPAKVTLLGSIIFTFQHTEHLSISRHDLVFLYTMFLVVTKIIMMTTETPIVPFAPFEATISRILFGWQQQFLPCEKQSEVSTSTTKSTAVISDKVKKKGTKKTD